MEKIVLQDVYERKKASVINIGTIFAASMLLTVGSIDSVHAKPNKTEYKSRVKENATVHLESGTRQKILSLWKEIKMSSSRSADGQFRKYIFQKRNQLKNTDPYLDTLFQQACAEANLAVGTSYTASLRKLLLNNSPGDQNLLEFMGHVECIAQVSALYNLSDER